MPTATRASNVHTARRGSVPFARLAAGLWRPLCAALVMVAAAPLVLPTGLQPPLLLLAVKGAWCVVVYPGVLMGLWLLSGRPAGFEQSAFQFTRAALRR